MSWRKEYGQKAPEKHPRIPGQKNPRDTAAKKFWKDNYRFTSLFNTAVFHANVIDPEKLQDADSNLSVQLEINNGGKLYIQQTQDIIKQLKDGNGTFVLFALEDYGEIDPLVVFRSWQYSFLGAARQISEIKTKHLREQSEDKETSRENKKKRMPLELLNGFYQEDLIAPTIQLALYTGKDEFSARTDLRDLFYPSPYRELECQYKLIVIDVRHMDEKELKTYPRELQELFGFLKYERSDRLYQFVHDKNLSFDNLMEETLDLLYEITHSSILGQIKQMGKTSKGGYNLCYGIEEYTKKKIDEEKDKNKKELEQLTIKKDKENKKELDKLTIKKDKEKKKALEQLSVKKDKEKKKALEQLSKQKEKEAKAEKHKDEIRVFVRTIKQCGFDFSDAVQKYAEQFNTSLQKAKKDLTLYWATC